MAFEPVRVHHPDNPADTALVVESATDLNNYLYRDGYVVSKDQENLFPERTDDERAAERFSGVPSEAALEASRTAAESETAPANAEEAKAEAKPEKTPAKTSRATAGTATDATGATVATQ